MKHHQNIPPAASVIIPAYNEEHTIGPCLDALIRQKTTLPYEIIVVDNHSTDHTAAIARQKNVRVIYEKRKGYGNAVKTGVSKALSGIILQTDADTVVNPHWVERVITALTKDPSLVAVGGPFVYTDGLAPVRAFVSLVQKIHPRIIAPTLCGMNMAYRKSAYNAVGGYLPDIQIQADSHLGMRLFRYGRVQFLRDNVVYASGRRYRTIPSMIRESAIRLLNNIVFRTTGRMLWRNQRDIR